MIRLTVSESRVGMFPAVLEALNKPDHILIRRGARKNEGKLIVEGIDKYCYHKHLLDKTQTASRNDLIKWPGVFLSVFSWGNWREIIRKKADQK